jgi:peptidyl-tRNA hydrolase, PTH1 family
VCLVKQWLIVGLGNPGNDYENTRHNVGFYIVDCLAQTIGAQSNAIKAGSWGIKDKAQIIQCTWCGDKLFLAKPQTFMNRSGESVGALLRFYKIPLENLLVVHDELDLALGVVRFKEGGGEAGHNGLRSISQMVGSQSYRRMRVGIGRPQEAKEQIMEGSTNGVNRKGVQKDTASWVLSKFRPAERLVLDEVSNKAVGFLEIVLKDGFLKAQNTANSAV